MQQYLHFKAVSPCYVKNQCEAARQIEAEVESTSDKRTILITSPPMAPTVGGDICFLADVQPAGVFHLKADRVFNDLVAYR